MPTKLPPKLKPLIKWTGGKYEEFQHFAACIPPFRHYYEPFFGGGGVFFALQPPGKSYVNDRSQDLINFYGSLGQPELATAMDLYLAAWEQTNTLADWYVQRYLPVFEAFVASTHDRAHVQALSLKWAQALPQKQFVPLFDAGFCLAPDKWLQCLVDSVADKMVRIRRICQKEGRVFSAEELSQHLTTAVKSAFYLHLRYLLNHQNAYARGVPPARWVANWYFVRELCYGSMFRYNAQGAFNIPYGGIAYNTKNMQQKVNAMHQPALLQLLGRTRFYKSDFEVFLNARKPSADDFIFLDPPYDSEFSSYDNNSFTRQDQERLCACLGKQQAKWLLIIKDTPFIKKLYKSLGASIRSFDKQYTYNVRGRNNREVRHLIISNYDTRRPELPAHLVI